MMMCVDDTVKKRITEKHVRMSHVDLRTKHLLSVSILSCLHLTEELEILLYASVAVRALRSRHLDCTTACTDLLLSLVIDICESLPDKFLRPLIKLVEIIRCISFVLPFEAEPLDIFVMLSQQNIYSTVNAAMRYIDMTPDDVSLSVLPVHHTYELMCLQAELLLGMTVCINDKLRHVVKNMNRFHPTVMTLVPLFLDTMEKKVWAEAEKKGKTKTLRAAIKTSDALRKTGVDMRRKLFADVHKAFGGNLRVIICGGAKLNPALIHTFDSFGITVYEGCGITECSPLTTLNPFYAPKAGSIGKPVGSCNLRLDTNGYGKNEKGYREGEIQVKGSNVMLGYYQNPEANAAVFTDDGWFRTGDVGYYDEQGYYYITGRCKSVIVLDNGKNVFPEEIEEYLGALDTVAECVVVGRKQDETSPTVLVAVIYPNYDKFAHDSSDENVNATILASIRAINRTLPSFKQVSRIELRKTEFEKTTSKKIKRHLVK